MKKKSQTGIRWVCTALLCWRKIKLFFRFNEDYAYFIFSYRSVFYHGPVFRSSNRDFLCRGSLVLHRVSVSSSNGCVRLRWLFERFKYRGCLELWIDGRKPGAGFNFNSEIAGSIVRAALWTASDNIARVAAIEQLCLKPKTLPSRDQINLKHHQLWMNPQSLST